MHRCAAGCRRHCRINACSAALWLESFSLLSITSSVLSGEADAILAIAALPKTHSAAITPTAHTSAVTGAAPGGAAANVELQRTSGARYRGSAGFVLASSDASSTALAACVRETTAIVEGRRAVPPCRNRSNCAQRFAMAASGKGTGEDANRSDSEKDSEPIVRVDPLGWSEAPVVRQSSQSSASPASVQPASH